MKVEVITIGDEILLGQTVDTNSAWIGQQLSAMGFEVSRIVSISDTVTEIVDALDNALSRSKIVLLTGGLGPTKDDITKTVLTEYFDTELELNQEVLAKIELFFVKHGREMIEANILQAHLPKACTVINNPKGTAAGMWFEKGGSVVVSMPGVPYEMKAIMEESVLSRLQEKFAPEGLKYQMIMTTGIGESFLAEKIRDWEMDLRSEGFELAYLPSPGSVKLRITGKGNMANTSLIAEKVEGLQLLIPNYIYSADDRRIEEVVGDLLKEKRKTISTAESCTGGYISHLLTSISGSSEYYLGSVIAYANAVKKSELNVSSSVIKENGVVSEAVVKQMAVGVRNKMKTDYGVSTSGIAGPDGGSEAKPVGTVWIAVSSGKGVVAKQFLFGSDRLRNIERAAKAALNMLRKEIEEEK